MTDTAQPATKRSGACTQAECDRAKLLMKFHSLRATASIMGISQNSLIGMRRRGFRAADYTSLSRPRPSDFAIQRNYLNVKQLMQHYRAGSRVVKRWNEEVSA